MSYSIFLGIIVPALAFMGYQQYQISKLEDEFRRMVPQLVIADLKMNYHFIWLRQLQCNSGMIAKDDADKEIAESMKMIEDHQKFLKEQCVDTSKNQKEPSQV